MRQFVKGRMIVQHEGDKRRVREGMLTSEGQYSQVFPQGIPESVEYQNVSNYT